MSDTVLTNAAKPFRLPGRTEHAPSPAAAIILALMMYSLIRTFVVEFLASIDGLSAWVYAIWLAGLYTAMVYTGRTSRYRRIFFVASAILFFPAFMYNNFVDRGSITLSSANIANSEAPFCHIVIPITMISSVLSRAVIFPARMSGHYASIYGMISLWLVASLTLGRGWCSWVCFYGGWDEGSAKLGKKRVLNMDKAGPAVRYFGFSMLVFLALTGLATATSVYCEWFCPFKLVTEFSPITDIASYVATIAFILIFFSLAVVLPILTKKRVQCGAFCPFGAFQSLTNKINVYRIKIDQSKCKGCMACVRACPTFSLRSVHIKEKAAEPGIGCTKCTDCIAACTHGAITLEYSGSVPRGISAAFDSLRERLARKTHIPARIGLEALNTVKDLLKPSSLFPFTAFTFGMIVTAPFAVRTLSLIKGLIMGGV